MGFFFRLISLSLLVWLVVSASDSYVECAHGLRGLIIMSLDAVYENVRHITTCVRSEHASAVHMVPRFDPNVCDCACAFFSDVISIL